MLEDNRSTQEQSSTSTQAAPVEKKEESGHTTVGSVLLGLVVSVVTIGASLFGLNRLGAQERGIEDSAQGLLARGQKAIGNYDDAARTNAHRLFSNVSAGAKVVADTVSECASTAATIVTNLAKNK